MKGPMLIFFFQRINTEENPFLFVTTPAMNMGDVHYVPQRYKTCQSAEFRCVEAPSFEICDPLGKQSFGMTL